MTHTRQLREVENSAPIGGERTLLPDEDASEYELKVTVRKLQLPVRPRGVLAE
jgi:hypothetical protein